MAFVPLPCPACGGGEGGSESIGEEGRGRIIVEGCPNGYASTLQLCDVVGDDCTPFLRHIAYTCDGEPRRVTDTDLSGTTPYTPSGTVADCATACGGNNGRTNEDDVSPPEPCTPVPMCARLSGISGPDTWTLPDGAESVTISILCGPVTVTDCGGEATVLNEGCGTLSWTAPSGDCKPGKLCTPLTVDIPEGSAVYVQWTEPCEGEA